MVAVAMKKRYVFYAVDEIDALRKKVLDQMTSNTESLQRVLAEETAVSFWKKLKFNKTVYDPLFEQKVNFIECLNQSFTYLACLYAARNMLMYYGAGGVIVNFGTQPGFDVVSLEGDMICECFTATSIKSNQKLKKDILRVNDHPLAKRKLVYFYVDNHSTEAEYIKSLQQLYPDVTLCRITFDELTKY